MDKRLSLSQPDFSEDETTTLNQAFLNRVQNKFADAESKFNSLL
jgi:hypothetical protein